MQLAPWPPEWADAAYLGALLPAWSQVTSRLVSAVSGSVAAAALLLWIVALVAVLVWPGGRRRVGKAIGWTAALLLLTFPLAFGLGYHTSPPVPWPGPQDASAFELARDDVLSVLVSAAPAGRPASGGVATYAQIADCVSDAAARLRGREVRLPRRVKRVPDGWLLRFGFSGFVFPWLLEPHLDAAVPPAARTAVALHEMAHGAGYAREAEAEAVAMLAGLSCDAPAVRYAAALRAASSLAARLPAAERAEYLAAWPGGAVDDLREAAAAAARYRTPRLARLAETAYDAYLVSQGAEGGMEDYDRATDLLVALLAARREAAGAVR